MSGTPSTASNATSCSTADILLSSMDRIDPFLRFLTKATGKTTVPLQMLEKVLSGVNEGGPTYTNQQNEILLELSLRGVLQYDSTKQSVGFPLPPSSTSEVCDDKLLPKPPSRLIGKGLHGSSEAVAKRRKKVLLWSVEIESRWICRIDGGHITDGGAESTKKAIEKSQLEKLSASEDDKKEVQQDCCGDKWKSNEMLNVEKKSVPMCEQNTQQDCCKTDAVDKDCKTANTHQAYMEVLGSETNKEPSEREEAYQALHNLFNEKRFGGDFRFASDAAVMNTQGGNIEEQTNKHWLPCQAAFAGSLPGRESDYGRLSNKTLDKIPVEIFELFNLDNGGANENRIGERIDCDTKTNKRKLFLHQARAIEAAMNEVHTIVCTSTGSGKSLCFLLPVLAKALSSLQQYGGTESASLLIFPTKALAQDQLTKINAMLKTLPLKSNDKNQLRAGVIDGDTPHQQRDAIASSCQIILTNPDTLHAAILPNWKRPSYKQLLERVSTVVIDETHVYEGTFGAHVALVLARLRRLCRVASSRCVTPNHGLLFIACSATLGLHPEDHFRALCPITRDEQVCVLDSDVDGSPCSPKHFFVWNPPCLDINGNSTGSVFPPKKERRDGGTMVSDTHADSNNELECTSGNHPYPRKKRRSSTDYNPTARDKFTSRRHSADETAYLLAKAITLQIRTIAFCKTRCLVEWVYERALSHLRSSDTTSYLASRIESYRGGYSADARRSIEERFFNGDLWGVVGTNALELGVDVGDIHLTLHCGYPGSRSSLLQQAGRSGRSTGLPSCAIIVSFSSPSEQYLWKVPSNALKSGINVMPTLPMNGSVLAGHLLCAGEEFPLTGKQPVCSLLNEMGFDSHSYCPTDEELFGSTDSYQEEIDQLIDKSLLKSRKVQTAKINQVVEEIECKETHPVVKPAWKRVNLRSIEPLNYAIIDMDHALQGGRTDKLVDKAAVLDSIPYSRVFYHAFPGAIITHRGTRYKIESMESPPPFLGGHSIARSRSTDLCSFARSTQLNYSTQALSTNEFNVVKQTDGIEVYMTDEIAGCNKSPTVSSTIAGKGIVNVKRSVHGYKKLSLVHRKELSRTSIVLPQMEFDTHGVWLDADAMNLREVIQNYDAGVHALSHAMVAVAPIFTPCTSSDVDCDHNRFECTRVLLYDKRAGGCGITHALYDQLFEILVAALDMLDDCTSCTSEVKYDGGCPGCLQSVPCDNFQEDLSRVAALKIGRYILKRFKESQANTLPSDAKSKKCVYKSKTVLIGRPSWLENRDQSSFAEVDE